MKITCHSCAAKYTVSDEKVQGKTVKMKCRKCGATIVVGGAAAPGEGAAEGGPDDGGGVDLPAGSYLVNVTEGDQRTMQLAEVIEAYNQGVVTGDTYVWADGMADWQALSENEVIVAALNAAASGAPTPAAAPYGGTNGTNGNHSYEQPAAAAYSAPPAAPAYGGGDYGAAPAYAASTHESARPAAARKDAGRKNDLFGGGGGGYESAGGGFGAQAAISSPGNTGKRDENSVLFSLSALTATSGPPSRPTAGATTATKEDSGLIDLKALAASATPAPQAQSAVPAIDTVGLFPLGAPVVAPPPAQMSMAGPASIAVPQKRSVLPLVLGGIVALSAIVGVFFVVRGTGQPTAPTATAAAAPAPTPTETAATPPPTATATAVADATSDATADASASAAPVAGNGKWRPKGGGAPAGGGTPPATGATAGGGKPQTPTPAGGKGPCASCGSDLHCMMKCSAGKK
ncbi:MAG: DUF4339 domain-containing protein [Polyangiaceae bacterium]|nr:DUF4339 domain-containing protein [Polyangiaceae bacterium]